jgi:arylsulfatase A-like enzyme
MRRRIASGRTPLLGAGLAATAVAARWGVARLHQPPVGVVVITLDTTRADRLSPYGYMNVSLPSLDRLATEGVVFDQATSVAPLTLPAHTSLFTGLLPQHHGVRDNADPALVETETTLAKTLQACGFRTGAFVGSVVLDPDRGLKQGFEHYEGVPPNDRGTPETRQRRANEVIDDALKWLDTIGDSRFFLWTHLYDPHRPYDPPEPYRTTYGHNLYVGEIAFVDAQIGRLLESLERRRLLERAVVVVVGDHGESLGAHGERDHGIFVYEDVLRIPLIVHAPGLSQRRVGEVVRITDVMPTVLEFLDVRSAPGDGVSLADLMRGRRSGLNLQAYSESLYPERLGWSALRALREGDVKLIDAPRPELYDLGEDPFEEHNIYDSRPAIADRMTARLSVLMQGRGSAKSQRQSRATPEMRAQLASLGYVSATAPRTPTARAGRPDPKDCIGAFSGAAEAIPRLLTCGPVPQNDHGSSGPSPPPIRR